MKKIFIITGEHSGDLHASFVVKELKKQNPSIEIQAVGGQNLAKEGIKLFCDHSKMGVMGINFKAIVEHLTLGKKILNYLKTEFKPDLVLLIDYGGFNLQMAKVLKKSGFTCFYYISPQVWASRKGRINKIKKYISKVMVLFPFEENFYKKENIDAQYVGHPLISQLPNDFDKAEFFKLNGLDKNKKLVGIFPGSRKMELNYLLSVFLKSAKLINERDRNVQFCIGQAPNISDKIMDEFLNKAKEYDLDIKILKNQNHALLSCSDAVMLASGTITMEASIYETPMIVAYKGPLWAYLIYLMLRYIKCASIPNIISGKEVVKEFLQYNAKPEPIANEILELLNNTEKRNQVIKNLKEIKNNFGDKIASYEVAKIINNYLKESENEKNG
ncbi:MAG: lipid-A-disaccharide synthase [Candidatus Gastranaerophilales bacterium]|nr:lipid-A-disaccharide synthase [Candidatus Gastranaerophilales bacterium]